MIDQSTSWFLLTLYFVYGAYITGQAVTLIKLKARHENMNVSSIAIFVLFVLGTLFWAPIAALKGLKDLIKPKKDGKNES